MECVKCGCKMVKGTVNGNIHIWGEEIKSPPRATYQKPYHPIYAYVCENCGYIEFYTNSETDD